MDATTSLRARAARNLWPDSGFFWRHLVCAGGLAAFLARVALSRPDGGFWIFFFFDLLKHDPQLLERRLQDKEREPEQKLFQRLFSAIMVSSLLMAGLDFRCGWSRTWLRPVPLVLVVAGYWLVFWVMKTNSFAGSTIQVEAGQRVIQVGPYALVRHPMYSGMAVTVLAAPLALGSYVALPVFASTVPLLIYRLIHGVL